LLGYRTATITNKSEKNTKNSNLSLMPRAAEEERSDKNASLTLTCLVMKMFGGEKRLVVRVQNGICKILVHLLLYIYAE
jgi:hypothetical protein